MADFEIRGVRSESMDYVLDSSPEVHMGQWKTTRSTLWTSGANTCIIFAALNTKTRNGLLGHFTAISDEDPNEGTDQILFNKALQVIPDLGPAAKTIIKMAGGSIKSDGEYYEDVIDDQQYAKNGVRIVAQEIGIPDENITVQWLSEHELAAAVVDCYNGEITIAEGTNAKIQLLHDKGLDSRSGVV